MTTYTVEMMLRFGDSDVILTRLPFDEWESAKRSAPNYMAVPKAWLVTRIINDETDEIVFDGC